jgi:hypothetical protein
VCAFAKLAPANGAELFLNFPVHSFPRNRAKRALARRVEIIYKHTHTVCRPKDFALRYKNHYVHAPRSFSPRADAKPKRRNRERERETRHRSIESAVMQARRVKAV